MALLDQRFEIFEMPVFAIRARSYSINEIAAHYLVR